MLVGNRMTKEPTTTEPDELLIRAAHKMQSGGFHRLPVVSDGKLVGIVTDRDLREHQGHLEHTKINGVMTEMPVTVTPATTLEDAAQTMLERQFGVVTRIGGRSGVADFPGQYRYEPEQGIMWFQGTTTLATRQFQLARLLGELSAADALRDILKAFLDVMGASHGGSTRIDFVLEGEEHGFVEATRLVAREGGEVLGIGTYREKLGENPVCYLRLLSGSPEKIAKALRASGFNVLGVHKVGG